jgi:replicative superfamily II helicase
MEQEKSRRLLLRQLKDIQAQAEKIMAGEDSEEALEAFSKYSSDLKEWINQTVEHENIKSYLIDLPEINYSSAKAKLWQYLILPSAWVSLYNDYHAKNKTIQNINIVRSKYATLELMIKGLT